MRWDNLFDDLESQLDAEQGAAQRDRERARERQRVFALSRDERIRTLLQSIDEVSCVIDGADCVLVVESYGKDWFAAEFKQPMIHRGLAVIPFAAVDSVSMSPNQARDTVMSAGESTPDEPSATLSLVSRVTYRIVLRDISRRRKLVRIYTRQGNLYGTIDRVGNDFLDLAHHDERTVRWANADSSIEMIGLESILFVLIDSAR